MQKVKIIFNFHKIILQRVWIANYSMRWRTLCYYYQNLLCKELSKIYTKIFIAIEKALQHLTYRIFPQKGDAEITFCAGLFLGSSFKNRLEIIFYCLTLPKLQLHRSPPFEPDNTFCYPWPPLHLIRMLF